jgi:hypothetical protein
MFDQNDFVTMFPEFGNVPPNAVALWSAQAYQQIDAYRLGANLDYAAMLWTAHNLYLSRRAQLSAEAGGASFGAALTVTSGKTVGSVSQTYDTEAAAITGAGEYNATSYGQRFYRLVQGACLGGLHIPGGGLPWSIPGISPPGSAPTLPLGAYWPWPQ